MLPFSVFAVVPFAPGFSIIGKLVWCLVSAGILLVLIPARLLFWVPTAALFASVVFSPARLVAFFGDFWRFNGFLLYTAYLVFFVSSTYLLSQNKQALNRFITALLFVSLPFAAYSLVSFLPLPEALARLLSYGNDDIRGMLLALVTPLAFSRKELSLFSTGFILLGGAALSSASGAVAATSGSLLMLYFLIRHGHSRRALAVALFIVVSAALVFTVPAAPFIQLKNGFSGALSPGSTFRERIIIWKASLEMIANRPVTGWGPGVMAYTFYRYEPEQLLEYEPSTSITDRAHNDIIQLALDGGMIYFLAETGLFIFLLLRSGRGFEVSGLLSALFAYLTASLAVFSNPQVTPFAAVLAGALLRVEPEKTESNLYGIMKLGLAGLMILTGIAAAVGQSGYGYASIAPPHTAERAAQVSSAALFWLPEPVILKGSIQSDIAFQTGDQEYLNEAEASFNRAIRRLPIERSAYLAAGRFYYLTDRLDEAEEMYRTAAGLSPSLDLSYLMLAKIYLEKNRPDTAVRFAEKAAALSSKAENHRILGIALFLRGDLDGSLDHLTEAASLQPGFLTYKTLGTAFLKLEDDEKAIYYFQAALEERYDPKLERVVSGLMEGKEPEVDFDI